MTEQRHPLPGRCKCPECGPPVMVGSPENWASLVVRPRLAPPRSDRLGPLQATLLAVLALGVGTVRLPGALVGLVVRIFTGLIPLALLVGGVAVLTKIVPGAGAEVALWGLILVIAAGAVVFVATVAVLGVSGRLGDQPDSGSKIRQSGPIEQVTGEISTDRTERR